MSVASNCNLFDDGFIKVTYKKKSKPPLTVQNQNYNSLPTYFDQEASVRRISSAKLELIYADILSSVTSLLGEGLSALKNPVISEIICLGLGKLSECTIARYQFALLLCLKEIYNVDVYAYDPIFDENDIKLLTHFSVIPLKENLEGKYKIRNKKTTLFYLPHCPKGLTNNLLCANWGLDLNYCIIISNSFNSTVERSLNQGHSTEYICQITPYVLELSTFDKMAGKLSILRRIISELRYALPEENLKNNLALRYIIDQYKKYKTTDEQLCKAREEMEFIVKTYLCYLKSSRLEKEIHNEFHGKGERSVEETAKMVGFKLPHDPK